MRCCGLLVAAGIAEFEGVQLFGQLFARQFDLGAVLTVQHALEVHDRLIDEHTLRAGGFFIQAFAAQQLQAVGLVFARVLLQVLQLPTAQLWSVDMILDMVLWSMTNSLQIMPEK